MPQPVVPEEQYPSKVSAEFVSEPLANRAVESLTREQGFKQQQISVIKPGDENVGHKVEPETRAIGATTGITHVVCVLGGLLLGLAVAWTLVNMGPALARANPLMTYMALAVISPMLGFFAGSVISMRPDHDRVLYKARAAADARRWTVVVHCANNQEKTLAREAMGHSAQTL
tara:strand:+ start:41601 stop:42119 length:519 start_codon:yes stop_codon:yes gene_type:complete